MWHWGYQEGNDMSDADMRADDISPALWLQDNRSLLSPHPGEEIMPDQDHIATLIPGFLWLDHNDSNLIDQVAAYVANTNQAMEQEGHHRDNQGQEMVWGQTREFRLLPRDMSP
jgi:hypothetical protein